MSTDIVRHICLPIEFIVVKREFMSLSFTSFPSLSNKLHMAYTGIYQYVPGHDIEDIRKTKQLSRVMPADNDLIYNSEEHTVQYSPFELLALHDYLPVSKFMIKMPAIWSIQHGLFSTRKWSRSHNN